MGVHKSQETLEIVKFLKNLGECLGYIAQYEEQMFPGQKTSPILDLSWRRHQQERYPIFIFEIDSTPEKSASDNAMKVFSKPTEKFQKPLFFFHVFVKQKYETDRIESLKSEYHKTNYEVYLLSEGSAASKLIVDVLDQHFRIESSLDLHSLIELLEENNPLGVETRVILNKLVQLEYDKNPETGFLSILEDLLISKKYSFLRTFYAEYLIRYIEYKENIKQNYPPFVTATGYSKVTHVALSVLLTNQNLNDRYNKLLYLENQWQPWELWEPFLGLSQDHDFVLLSEFPLLLSLLCLAFSASPQAQYFSQKLRKIMEKSGKLDNMNTHGYYWLLIASKIAGDKSSYDFARLIINEKGGISISRFILPSAYAGEDYDDSGKKVLIPEFEEWAKFTDMVNNSNEHIDFLIEIIEGFLYMDQWELARKRFGIYCLQESIKKP